MGARAMNSAARRGAARAPNVGLRRGLVHKGPGVRPTLRDFSAAIALRTYLMRYAYSLTRSRADSEDLVQSTLLRAWIGRESFAEQHEGSLKAWLKRILYNLHVEPFSHPRSVRAVRLPQLFAHEPYPCAGEHAVALDELDCALDTLAPDRRDCFLMARAGYGYEEIAQFCGCRLGTVKSRVNRVESELLAMLEAA